MGIGDKLLAEWFWTDRWMGSSAFLLPLEARGLYREMLTQAWRRGAKLPNDHAAIQRAAGVSLEEWQRCWPLVAPFWRVEGQSLVNDTQLEIYEETIARYEKESAAGRTASAARWGKPKPAPAKAKPEKPERHFKGTASGLYVSERMHAIVVQSLGKRAAGVDWPACYTKADLAYADTGIPERLLEDLKRRARLAADERRDSMTGPPSAERTKEFLEKMEQERKPLTDEEKAAVKASLRGALSIRV